MKSFFAPHLNRHVKLGRKRSVAIGPHLKLRNYLRAALPTPPSSVDYSSAAAASLSDVMKNDELGCCVIAGGYHVEGVETGNAGNLYVPSDAQIIADYSAIGGYVPGDPSTDNGCDLQTAMNYWSQSGFKNGTKLLGYLAVDPTNQQEVMTACWLFENLYHAFELPDEWISPFPSSSGFVWDDAQPDQNNGHCVCSVGYDSNGVRICTWGMLGSVTWRALAHLGSQSAGGELWVLLSPDQLAKGQTKAPNGVDWTSLLADWDALGGNVPLPKPPPGPPAPPPAPTPGAAPTLAQAQAATTAAIQSMHPLMTRQQAENAVNSALAPLWPSS